MIEKIILIILGLLSKSAKVEGSIFSLIEKFLVGRLSDDERAKYWKKYEDAKSLEDAKDAFREIVAGGGSGDAANDPKSDRKL